MTGCRIHKFGIFTISWLGSVCMNVKIRNKFIEIKYSVSNGLVIFITNYWWFRILEISRYRWSNGSILNVVEEFGGSGQGLPLSPLPSPLPPLPFFSPPLPSPWNILPAPIEKNSSSHRITFHFSAWIIIKALRPEDCRGQFVCSSVHLLVWFGVLQPSQRPSRQHCSQVRPCPRRKGIDKGRQDRGEKHTTTTNRSLSYYNPKQ